MLKRNIPLILFFSVFVMILYGLYITPRYPKQEIFLEEAEEFIQMPFFKGRVEMPAIDDLYVLENTAGRDVLKLGKFLQGRAAGLHWLAEDHFRGYDEDVVVGVRLTIDSLGRVEKPIIDFCSTNDEDFKKRLRDHIRLFWVYPRSVSGVTEIWIPIKWDAHYEAPATEG